NLKVLVTSRERLDVYGEHNYAVPPLMVADPNRLPSTDRLAQFGAVRLFVDRARAVSPGFALTDDNARVVVEICRRLDGLPLPIELAAARVRLMTPSAIAARLEDRLAFLTGGPRDHPTRLRSLRAAIAWSNDLLSGEEHELFRRLSVFAGGFTPA